jgi:hypothetical protein
MHRACGKGSYCTAKGNKANQHSQQFPRHYRLDWASLSTTADCFIADVTPSKSKAKSHEKADAKHICIISDSQEN